MAEAGDRSAAGAAMGAARAFWAGLTRPSLAGAVGTPLAAAACFLLASALATPERLAHVPPGYVMADEDDEAAVVTVQCMALRHDPPAGPVVALLGASDLREAIVDPDKLGEKLTGRVGRPVRVYHLASASQGYWQMTTVGDYLPPDTPGVAMLSTGIIRSNYTPEDLFGFLTRHQMHALPSESFRDEVRRSGLEPPRRTGIYLVDYLDFYSPRLPAIGRNLLIGPQQLRHGRFGPDRPRPTEADWQRWQEGYARRLADRETTVPDNMARLGRLIDRIRNRTRLTVVLYEPPMPPRGRAMLGEARTYYLDQVRQLVNGRDVIYWNDIYEAADLTPEDFIDLVHINQPPARRRVVNLLAERMAPLLADQSEDRP